MYFSRLIVFYLQFYTYFQFSTLFVYWILGTLQPADNSNCGLVFYFVFYQFGQLVTSLFNTVFVCVEFP